MLKVLFLALVVGTWNGNWFPSGRAEHRAHPEVEAATVSAAGKMLKATVDRLDPEGREDIILCLNEIRGPKVARELAEAIGRKGLKLASISAYRRRDRFDQQQDAILTTLPVVAAGNGFFKGRGGVVPPRGYAKAEVMLGAVTAAVYAVHLKANYGATDEAARTMNRRKRTAAVRQLLELETGARPVLVAGDMNADKWRKEFREETIFDDFAAAGFRNLLELLGPRERGTHPSKRWGDSALDYVFARGVGSAGARAVIGDSSDLSDHNPFMVRIDP